MAQLDLRSYVGTIEYTETEEEEKNVKVLDLVKNGEIAFSTPLSLLTALAVAAVCHPRPVCIAGRSWTFNKPCLPHVLC